MQYLAIKWDKNPLLKIKCCKCEKQIENGAIICGDNKQRSPSAFFCEDCLSKDLLMTIRKKFNDPGGSIKYLM